MGLFVYLAVRLFLPLRVPLPAEDLALSVESRFRHLKDRLAAALDFEDELTQPTRGESADDDGARRPRGGRGGARPELLQGRHRAPRARAGAVRRCSCSAWPRAPSAALKDDVGLWARRSLLLDDVAWPRDTLMVAVDLLPDGTYRPHDPTQPYEVPIGRSLTVYAQAEGSVPDEAQVLDLVAGQDPLARRMFGVPGKEGLFAYEFLRRATSVRVRRARRRRRRRHTALPRSRSPSRRAC